MDFLAARRFLGALALVLIGIGLASACASPPVSQGTGVPGTLALSPAWGGGPPERGMLIMAAPLPGEGAQPVLDLVRPEMLGLQVNVKALDTAGFYRALAGLKPRLGTALPVRVRYWTADAAGREVQATGLVYLPFTVFGWYPAEGEVLRPDRFFGPAILAELAVMFDGRTTGATMNRRIAELQGVPEGKAVAARLLRPEARSALADPEHDPWGAQMLEALRRNDLYDWDCPKGVPVHLMATRADEQVPWGNSLLAAERLAARGAAVDFTELDQATHEKGGYEAYARMLVAVWRETGIAPR
jgi:hypothetical protein